MSEKFLTESDRIAYAYANMLNESVVKQPESTDVVSSEESVEYPFYIIVDYGKGWKIHGGYDSKDDAVDASKPGECPRTKDCKIKIVARVTLKKFGLDASNDGDWMKGVPDGMITVNEVAPVAVAVPAAAWTAGEVASILAAAGASAILVKNAPEFAKTLTRMGASLQEGKEWLMDKISLPEFEGIPYTADKEAIMKANSYNNHLATASNPIKTSIVSNIYNDPKYSSDGNKKDGFIKRALKKIEKPIRKVVPKSKHEFIPKTPKDIAITVARAAEAEGVKRGADYVADEMEDKAIKDGNDNLWKASNIVRGIGNTAGFVLTPNNVIGKGAVATLPSVLGIPAMAYGSKYQPFLFGQSGSYFSDIFQNAEDYNAEQPEDTTVADEIINKYRDNPK